MVIDPKIDWKGRYRLSPRDERFVVRSYTMSLLEKKKDCSSDQTVYILLSCICKSRTQGTVLDLGDFWITANWFDS